MDSSVIIIFIECIWEMTSVQLLCMLYWQLDCVVEILGGDYRIVLEMIIELYQKSRVEIQNYYINCTSPQVNSAQRKYREDYVRVIPKYIIEKENKRKNRGFTPLEGQTFSDVVGRSSALVE